MVQCTVCRFVTVHPLPDRATLEAYYDRTRTGEAQRRSGRKLLAEFLTSTNNPKRDFFRDVLARVTGVLGKGSLDILEIGSGLGTFVHYANLTGHRATGTEATSSYADLSSESLAGRIVYVKEARYEEYFASDAFDLIYMEHAFEHLVEPERFLKEARRMLRPGSVLFLAVPNMDSLSSRVQGRFWSWAIPPDHLYFYTSENLSRLLERHGFTVTEAFARDYYHRSIPQMFSLRRAANVVRRLFGLTPLPHRYTYPSTPADHLMLAPYYVLYPVIRWSWARSAGSELVVVARRSE
jgi:SAM-dependent methyltransferase